MVTFSGNPGDDGASDLGRIGRGMTPFVNTGAWADRPGRAQLGIGDDGLTAYRRAVLALGPDAQVSSGQSAKSAGSEQVASWEDADTVALAANALSQDSLENRASWESGYTGQYIGTNALDQALVDLENSPKPFIPRLGSFAAGGLVGSPDSYADGGEVGQMMNGDITKEEAALVQGAIAALSPESKMTPEERQAILVELENVFGEGSVEALMAEMQKASGQSDGRSDSIPAVIDGVQPAALSEGEFVVPADIVSYIGKGSTQSGARELQGMIDMMRSSRGAGPQQPQPVGPQVPTQAGR